MQVMYGKYEAFEECLVILEMMLGIYIVTVEHK